MNAYDQEETAENRIADVQRQARTYTVATIRAKLGMAMVRAGDAVDVMARGGDLEQIAYARAELDIYTRVFTFLETLTFQGL
jgi:hypothetical protein